MIDRDEMRRWRSHFGVDELQVRRDHLLSHILNALPDLLPSAVFIGGTALSRTLLLDDRLSEDLDLLVEDGREAGDVLARLPRHIRREFPQAITRHGGREQLVLSGPSPVGPLNVRIQLIAKGPDYDYPTEIRSVRLRFTDLPRDVAMETPTPAASVAMKSRAWADRATPRDLYDLAGLAERGHVSREAHELLRKVDGIGAVPEYFHRVPTSTQARWEEALAHQTQSPGDPRRCLDVVRAAWTSVLDW